MNDATTRTDAAFTLVELIIAIVLLAIAIGMVGTFIVSSLSGAGTSTSGAMSDTAAARVTARFQDDLAVAETEDRARRLVREQVVLDAALRNDANAVSDDPSTPNVNVDLEDITVATPTRLQFKAEVERSAPGVECVTWEAVRTGDELRMIRTVAGPDCVTQIESAVLATSRADAEGVVLEPFTYRLMCSRTLCGAESLAPAATPCATWTATDVATRKQRRWIVGVDLNLVAHSGAQATRTATSARMAIRSREEHMWRTGLGC